MSNKTAIPTAVDAAKVLIEEAVLVRWQHWRTWLQLSLERLRLREEMEAADAGFDLDEAPQKARLREIETQIATIPTEMRSDFQAVYEERRAGIADDDQRSGKLPRDMAEIDRATLKELLDLCMGDPAADRPGMVPEKGQWYKLDARALSSVPTAAHYSVGAAPRRKRADLSSILVMVALILVVGVFLWGQYFTRGSELAEVAAAPALLVNDAPVAPWRPLTLAVLGTDMGLPIKSTARSRWPHADEGKVGWREGSIWPVELCVTREALPEVSAQVQIASEGATLVRTYQLAAEAADLLAPASLTIRTCDDENEVRYGALASSAPPPSAAPGETQALTNSPHLTVLDVAAVGPGQTSDIPADKVRVSLLVSSDRPIADWSPLRPRLQLASGALLEPMTEPMALADGRTELTYLAASYQVQMPAAWEVSDQSTGEMIRWRVTLPAPDSRLTYLDKYLRVETPRASVPEAGMLHLEIPMTTMSLGDITLRYEDIAARQGTTVISVPTFSQEDGTVTPGRTTTLALVLLLPEQGQEVTLTIGRQVFAIQVSEGR